MTRSLICLVCLACLVSSAMVERLPGQVTASRPRSYLGVGVSDIDQQRAAALKLTDAGGVEINVIVEGSPAAKAGLLKGDVVLELNGARVASSDDFIRMVREAPTGHKMGLRILRNGATQTVTAVVGARAVQAWPVPEGVFTLNLPRPVVMWQNGFVGIGAESLTGQLAEYFGVKEGVLIRSVARNSPGDKGGLKAGDVVVKVNGEAVTSPGEVSSQMHGANLSTRSVAWVVVRNHHEMTLNVGVMEP